MNRVTIKSLLQKYPFLKRPLIYLVVLSSFLSVTAVVFAYLSKLTVDASTQDDSTLFLYGAGGLVVVLLVQLLLRAVHNYYSISIISVTQKQIQQNLFHNILYKRLRDNEELHSGEWMNYLMSDVRQIASGLVGIIPNIFFLGLRFLFAFILLFYLDSLFAIIMASAGILLFITSFIIRNELKLRHNRMQDEEARLRSFMQEGLEYPILIKSFQAEQYIEDTLIKKQTDYKDSILHKNKLQIIAGTVLKGFFAAGYAFALIFGAYRIGLDLLTFGSLLAIIQLVEFMQSPFRQFSQLLPQYYSMVASVKRLQFIDDLEPEVSVDETRSDFDTIVFDQVSFTYHKTLILNHLSFTIPKQSFIHIKGESGIGKTTIFKLLLGLITPDQGRAFIQLDNENINCSVTTRSLFSYVPQGLMIISGSIRDNLIYNQKNISDEQVTKALKIAEVYTDIMKLPNKLDTIIGERGYGLSEGQLQRLAIARALIKDSPILLLDEITSALDQNTEEKVLDNIKKLTNKTCIIISHRPLISVPIDKTIHLSSTM